MAPPQTNAPISIRDLTSLDDLKQAESVEKQVWGVADLDVMPLTMAVATKEAGSVWVGAFERNKLIGFVFGFLGIENGTVMVHSHMLAVLPGYRDLNLGYKLKLAQRDRALAMRIQRMTWTFDPLQSKNAHFNFCKLGVVSNNYKPDFYGTSTSSVLHRNSTDRLWVTWPMASRRVQQRLQGKDPIAEVLDALSGLPPLVRFNVDGTPVRTDLHAALARQRIAIEVPSDIAVIEDSNPTLAREWRMATRWGFSEALNSGFFVAEFCRSIRGKQGPGVYLLQKGAMEEYVPELAHDLRR